MQKHKLESDCWIVLHGEVYDVTEFLDNHPGGKKEIMKYAGGKNCDEIWDEIHTRDLLICYDEIHKIG